MKRGAWLQRLPGLALGLLCGSAGAQTWLQMCPDAAAPAGRVQANIVRPSGGSQRVVVTATGPSAGCAALPLGDAGQHALAVRPIARRVAQALGPGLSLSGAGQDEAFAISEVITRPGPEAAAAAAQPLPLATNLLPLLQAHAFGTEARASIRTVDRDVLLQCSQGQRPAGLTLSVPRPLPGGNWVLRLRTSGNGRMELNTATTDDAARESGTRLGTLDMAGDSEPRTSHYALPGNHRGTAPWHHWTIACPPDAGHLRLHDLQLQPVPLPAPGRATWVWQAGAWSDTPESVLARAQRHGLRTLFITVPLASDAVQAPEQLAQFIRRAWRAGIAVWAVDGDPHMVQPTEHAKAAARAGAYVQYNRQAAPDARLAGLQFDVEPYLLPGYDLAPEAWEQHYLALVSALSTGAAGLPLEMVVPFWWGDKVALLDALAPRVSSLTVMDYRTQPDEIVRFAQPFFEWGNRQGRGVRIALEAGPIGAETLRQYTAGATGELWQLRLAEQDVLLLLAAPAANPHGPAFRQSGSAVLSGDATTFHAQPQRLLDMLPRLEAEFAAWPEFSGMALHELP